MEMFLTFVGTGTPLSSHTVRSLSEIRRNTKALHRTTLNSSVLRVVSPGLQRQWQCSVWRSKQKLSINGIEVEPSEPRRMSATSTAAESEVVGSSATFQKSEEEVVEGCTVQHREMSSDGITIHFVEAGDPGGKLVLLVHGWPNFWFVWKRQFQPLVEAGYHVIAPDLRGYNTSSKPEAVQAYSRSAVLSDLVKLIDKFGAGKPVIVVGHDWGAIIAWALVEDFPNKVEILVTASMGRLTDFQRILRSNFGQLRRSWYIGLFQIPVVSEWILGYDNMRFLRNLQSAAPAATDEDIRRHVEAYSNPGSLKGGISYYRAAIRGFWSRQDGNVPVVTTPTTVIWGDQDAYCLPIIAETDKEKAPHVNVVHFSKSGHWPMWDEPALFNETVLKAISREGEGS